MLQHCGQCAQFYSSTTPKTMPSKGCFIQRMVRKGVWDPQDTLFVDDGAENIQSVWEDVDAGGNREIPVAHTLRLPDRGQGLTESDLQLIER